MDKTAFVFPGQGSQKVGMGADLLAETPQVFDRYLSRADQATGLEIRRLCLEGPIELLTATDVAQPALFATSLAVFELARERDLKPDLVAGHSLGEYTAAVAAGALSFDDGIHLVAQRGRLMADIQSHRPGAMAAIMGLSAERVQELCAQAAGRGIVVAANLNAPAQVVCSGEEAAVLALIELAQQAGAERAVRLQVGAAFHSPLMEPVQREMAQAMQALSWRDPDIPLVANATGAVTTTAVDIREALTAQIASPVRWVDCVRRLAREGCASFLELGSGRTLSALIRQIEPGAQTLAADSGGKLERVLARVRGYAGP